MHHKTSDFLATEVHSRGVATSNILSPEFQLSLFEYWMVAIVTN